MKISERVHGLVSAVEASRILHLAEAKVYKAIADGEIDAGQVSGRIVVELAEVTAWKEQRPDDRRLGPRPCEVRPAVLREWHSLRDGMDLSCLKPTERSVFLARCEPQTYTAIGEAHGFSRQRAYQLMCSALQKLRYRYYSQKAHEKVSA